MLLFQTLKSPRDREILEFVTAKGGPKKCLEDDVVFEELVTKFGASTDLDPASSPIPSKRRLSMSLSGPDDLKNTDAVLLTTIREEVSDLNKELDVLLQKNFARFDQKFMAQSRQLKDLNDNVTRQGDRVIKSFRKGPHNKVRNQVCPQKCGVFVIREPLCAGPS